MGEKYCLSVSTIQKAYCYVDVFLSNIPTSRDALQLIGGAALRLAVKVRHSVQSDGCINCFIG